MKGKDEELKQKQIQLINRGDTIIYPEKIEKWKEIVLSATGYDLEVFLPDVIEIMEILENNGTLQQARETMKFSGSALRSSYESDIEFF